MQRRLALEHSAPLTYSLRFFVSAPAFAALAGALLLWQGPAAFASRWSPAMLAATHLITLGTLSMVIIGALLQLLPVVADVAFSGPRLSARAMHALLCCGTALLAAAFLGGHALLFKLALAALILALLWLPAACARGLWQARPGPADAMLGGVRVALFALLLTVALGAVMGVALALGLPWPLARLTELHLLFGALGWIGALLTAIAYQVIPMFQVTPVYPAALTSTFSRALLLLLLAAGGAGIAGHSSLALAHALLAGAFALFALLTLRLLAQRKRPAPDPTTLFWRTSMASLLACAALWFAPLEATPKALLLGVLFFLGFAFSAVVGMLYKIVPFLLWQEWQVQGFGKPVPSIRLIITEAAARGQFWSHVAAVALLAGAAVWPALARPAALAVLASNGYLGWNLWRALRLQPRLQPAY